MFSGPATAEVSAVQFVPGGVVVAGRSERGVRVGGQEIAQTPGPFLVALDDVGSPRWSVTIGSRGTADIDAVTLAPGPALVFSGWFQGELVNGADKLESTGADCLVGRLDLDGELVWLRAFGGPGKDVCRRLDVDEEGKVWVVGSYEAAFEDLPPPRGMSDVMVLGLEASTGELRHTFGFGGMGDDLGRDVTVDGEGSLIVTGTFGGPYDATGRKLLSSTDAALVLSDTLRLVPAGDYDGFAALFDPQGAPLWATAVSGPGFDVVKQAIVDGDGFIIVGSQQQDAPPAGTSGMASDVPLQAFVTRLGADGTATWSFTDPLLASVHQVALLRDRLALVGHHRHGFDLGQGPWPVAGDTGITLALLDATGNLVGGYGCDSPGPDFGHTVATTSDGRIAFGGNTSPGGRCAPGSDPHPAGFVRLMVLDPQGVLRPLVVER